MSKRTFADMMVRLGADTRKFDQKFKKAQSSTKHLQSQLNTLKGALIGVFTVSGINNLLESYNTQAQAENTLLTALKGRKDLADQLITQAGELQSMTLFGDEETIKAQALAASMGLTIDQIKQMIPAAQNLATATGMTLEGAVKNLARTYGGLTGELGEAIPALRNLTKEEMAAGGAIKLVNDLMGGQAVAAAQAGTGGLKQIINMLGDLGEVAGEVFYKQLSPALENLKEKFSNLSENTPQLKENFERLAVGLKLLAEYFIISKGYTLIWTNTLKKAFGASQLFSNSLFALPARFNSVTKAMGTMTTAQRVMKTATISLTAVTKSLWGVLKANPLGAVFLAFEGISAIIRKVKKDSEDLNSDFAQGLKDELSDFIAQDDISKLENRMKDFRHLTKSQLEGLQSEVKTAISQTKEILSGLSATEGTAGVDLLGGSLNEQLKTYKTALWEIKGALNTLNETQVVATKSNQDYWATWEDSLGTVREIGNALFQSLVSPIEAAQAKIQEITETAFGRSDAIFDLFGGMGEESFEEPILTRLEAAKEKITGKAQELASALNSVLSEGLQEAFMFLGSIVEDAFSGNLGSFDDYAKDLLGKFGDFAKKMGTMMLSYGIALKAFKSMDATTMIVAGGALLAIGSAIKGLASRGVSGGASGGGGSSSFGFSQNNMNYGYGQQTLTTKVSGKDLLLVLNNQKSFNARTGSINIVVE